MIGLYKFYKSTNSYLCYLNNNFRDRKTKSTVYFCGFLKVTVSSAVRLNKARFWPASLQNERQTNPLEKMYSHKI